jgi:phosphoribosyl 1,2-cyclic phosphodiesterase
MSVFFRTLRSGSSGNGLLLWTRAGALLIDLGLPARTALQQALTEMRQRKIPILGALITHEHGDHFSPGPLRVMSGHGITVHAPCGARRHAEEQLKLGYWSGRPEFQCYDEGESWERDFYLGPFRIRPIEVSHAPSVNCYAFHIQAETRKGIVNCVIATDLCGSTGLPDYLVDADLIYLECNYDPFLLERHPNPSSRFHLENGKCGKMLAAARRKSKQPPKHVFLGHLSERRNSPTIALTAVADAFTHAGVDLDFPVTASPRHLPSVTVEISADDPSCPAAETIAGTQSPV